MLESISPLKTKSWQELSLHFESMKQVRMDGLFETDPHRFDKFSVQFNDILVDYSKNIITEKTLRHLLELADELKLKDAIERLFSGDDINRTEGRSVLHTALRNLEDVSIFCKNIDVMPGIRRVRLQMKRFSKEIGAGRLRGYTGKPITNFVNIGIGGSDLGPRMVTECLQPFARNGATVHFVSNIDGAHLVETLKNVDPETTLFLVASKSFTTQETMANAHSAREWLLSHAGEKNAVKKHFVAISTNAPAVEAFGISRDNMFEFWDWVGGRYSLWSAIGLSIVCYIGYEHFEDLLRGAQQMDDHFRNTAFENNIPVILALLGVWYTNFFGADTEAIFPYDYSMREFPAYLQQVNMESNGKSTDRNGEKVDYKTGPIIWGAPGTNGQHAFFQLMHQGRTMVPADFLAPAMSHYSMGNHHEILLANFFAQTEALLHGRTEAVVLRDLKDKGVETQWINKRLPHCLFDGNRPTNTILFRKMTPRTLGQLIAMYEHKIFTQGVIWNIFSFDQWGVELGKDLARSILPELSDSEPVGTHDGSTNGLINAWKTMIRGATEPSALQ